jgi:drug/metabolite transporter (DMT)-like permease
MSNKETGNAVVVMVFLVVMWGYSWITSKIGLDYASPLDFAAVRVLLGIVFLFLFLLWSKASLRPQHFPWLVFIGMVQTSAFIILNTWALSEGEPGRTSVLVFTMPFWVLVFAWPALGERIHGLQWIAIGFAVAGLLLVIQPWDMHTSLRSKILAVLAGVCWAISVVAAKRLHARAKVDEAAFTFWQMAIGVIPILALNAIFDTRPIEWTPAFIGASLFNGVIATGLGWLAWLYVLHRLPAGTTSLSSLGIPVIAGLASWLQLGEQPSALELSGMLLIGIALGLVSWLTIRKHEEPEVLTGQE